MTPEEKTPSEDETPRTPRKPYVPPQLIVHGAVEEITGITGGLPIDATTTGSSVA